MNTPSANSPKHASETDTSANSPRLRNLHSQVEYILGETTIVGRHEDCNLVLESERGASRKHARITVEDQKTILMDLGSLNGTTVNGREISRAVQLIDGDIVVFDEHQYLFQAPDSPQSGNSDNVTVIANKDEIGRPDRIKPAIRVVDTATFNDAPSGDKSPEQNLNKASETSFDDTEAWPATDAMSSAAPQAHNNTYTGNTAIPATSRPGGDAPTPKRLQQNSSARIQGKKPKWMLWLIVVPLLVLVLLAAFYFAYHAGFSAGHITDQTSESS